MKMGWLMTAVLVLGLQVVSAPSTVSADTITSVRAKIPSFPVEVNGIIIDNKHAAYPLLIYKDITYFPMTWDYTKALGLSIQWEPARGLEINNGNAANEWSQDTSANNNFNMLYQAYFPSYPIKVNGQMIDNYREEYPVLNFRDITYFPMTWRFTHDTFHMNTQWDALSGFKIGTVIQEDIWNLAQLEVGTQIHGDPFNLYWSVNNTNVSITPNGSAIFDRGNTIAFNFTATHIRDQNISINKPVSLELEVRRVPAGTSLNDTANQKVVWSSSLPVLQGNFTGKGDARTLKAYWNQKDFNGNQVPAGTYIARLVTPFSIDYMDKDTVRTEVLNDLDVNRGGREFNIN